MVNIDWEFELEIAQSIISDKEVVDVVELNEGKKLDRFSYDDKNGIAVIFKVPEQLYDAGFAHMTIDGLPLELTVLTGNRIEIRWVVGMHEHAK